MSIAAVLSLACITFGGAMLAQPARRTLPPPAAADPFVGVWRLNLHKSRLGPDDRTVTDERSYDRYGESVIVTWKQNLDGRQAHGSYAAKCNGKPAELPDKAVLICRYIAANVVEGEIHDRRDPKRVYYRRSTSKDGKTLTIAWYADAGRTRPLTTRVYDRVPE